MSEGRALKDRYDLVVVGAGPAGLAAATAATRLGLDTVLLDEQGSPGGQIYRAVAATPLRDKALLGEDYWQGAALVETFRHSGAAYVPGATVWSLSPEREVAFSIAGAAQLLQARHVILATGALERPFPIPGWTLPGVMSAGAAQILLKSSGLVAEGRVVLAGAGPLLWLLAAQYLRAGKRIELILQTSPRANHRRALRHFPAFLASAYFVKGLRLVAAVARRVKIVRDVSELRALGDESLRGVAYRQGGGAERHVEADTLLLHHGVVPNLNLALAAGCAYGWDAVSFASRRSPTIGG